MAAGGNPDRVFARCWRKRCALQPDQADQPIGRYSHFRIAEHFFFLESVSRNGSQRSRTSWTKVPSVVIILVVIVIVIVVLLILVDEKIAAPGEYFRADVLR